MRVLKLNSDTYEDVLSLVERVVRDGGVVVMPTDTVYGIVGRALDERVVKKIFQMKGRSRKKPIGVFARDLEMARRYVEVPGRYASFLGRVWPGSVTAVLNKKGQFSGSPTSTAHIKRYVRGPAGGTNIGDVGLPSILTGGKDTVGVRVPDDKFLLDLLGRLSEPLVQTSANISDEPPARSAQEVLGYFEDSRFKPDLIVDPVRAAPRRGGATSDGASGGEVPGVSSTVVDLSGDVPVVLREGVVRRDGIMRSLKE